MGRRLPADTLPGYPLPIDQLVTVVLDDATLLAALPGTTSEVAARVGYSHKMTWEYLRALRKAGLVVSETRVGWPTEIWWEQA